MRYTVKVKGVGLLCLLVFHVGVSSPVIKRDLLLAAAASPPAASKHASDDLSLLHTAPQIGALSEDPNVRVKRTLKTVKAIGLGAGLKAAGAGIKAAGALGLKTVAKAGVKTVATVGVKLAKAAITIGIAKLLLNLVFGKINQLIDFKTRLLSGGGKGGSGLLSVSSLSNSNGGAGGSSDAFQDDDDDTSTESSDSDDLPEIDPSKVELQVPSTFISGGFNVVNRASPVVGDVIQNTAERVARLVETLKPLLRKRLGLASTKREAGEGEEVQDSGFPTPQEINNL